MKYRQLIIIAMVAASGAAAYAQDGVRQSSSLYLPAYSKADVSLTFDTQAEGIRFEPTWGLDMAWINEQNLKKGVNHMLKENVGIGRTSFRVLNALKDDGSLTSDQIEGLRTRSNGFNNVVGKNLPLVINCDNGYMPNGYTGPYINTYYTSNKTANIEHWAKVIEAHVAWMKDNTTHPIVGVSPFNEPDNALEKNLAGEIQGNQTHEASIARVLKTYPSMDGIAISGGNTLNNDNALTWYNAGKQYYDWGNTHQLAGSFDNFAKFYQQLKKDGKVGFDDEMHNVVEAMVGLEYGMTYGIWWGFDSRARGEFCQISRHGERLAYGEHRANWTAASVWRHDDGRVKAFIGSSERQAVTTTYQFLSTDRDVYYDGYGPVREFMMEIPGGAPNSYSNGQTNAERVIDVTWGEDVAPCVLNGVYKLVNKQSGNVVGYTASGSNIALQIFAASNKKQQWTVKPCSSRTGGDYSFYDIESVDNKNVRLNAKDYATSTGTDVIAWTQTAPTSNEQWYLEYAGDGYYYLRNRESGLYLAAASVAPQARLIQTTMLAESARSRMLFRFLPVAVGYETVAPAQPSGLVAEARAASVTLNWDANADSDVEGYMVLRSTKDNADWNTIARMLTTTTFTDNNCRQGVTYIYKVKAIDRAQNLSAASAEVEATPTGAASLVAHWQMEDQLTDATDNMMDAATNGTPTYVDGGKQGQKALRLTTSQKQYVQLPYEVAGSDELTVMMWVYMRSASSFQRLFDFGSDTDHYLYLTPSTGSTVRFGIKNGDSEQTVDAKSKLPMSQWKHVAVTIGSTKTTIYIDGEEEGSSSSITISPNDVRPVLNYLGRSRFANHPFLWADIDDVRIYNYALSAADVKAVMEGGEATAIRDNSVRDAQPSAVYGIDGIRRDAPQRGLNIIDGKKVMK